MTSIINLDMVAWLAVAVSAWLAWRKDHAGALAAAGASLFCSCRSAAARRRRNDPE